MSLDKSIEHGKEKRRRYHGMKECDSTCRNNGFRTEKHSNKKRKAQSEYECDDCFDTGCVCGGIGHNCDGCCHCVTARDLLGGD